MSTTTQPPKPKRRWYQFSLLTMLVVMTVATVAFGGWVQYRRYLAQENRERVAAVDEAVATLRDFGGKVEFDYDELRPQTWLEKCFDDPGYNDAPLGILIDTELNDTTADCLKRLIILRDLGVHLKSTMVTDTSLEHLARLTNLEDLYLQHTGVTYEGVKKLQQALPNCKMQIDDPPP